MTKSMSARTIAEPADSGGPLYAGLLAADWTRLHPNLADAHSIGHGRRARGDFYFTHGQSLMAKFVVAINRVPKPGAPVPTVLSIAADARGEHWDRRFGTLSIRSVQRSSRQRQLIERFRFIEFAISVRLHESGLVYESTSMSLCIGPLRIPMPALFSAKVNAVETPRQSGTRVNVSVLFPGSWLLFSYAGALDWEAQE